MGKNSVSPGCAKTCRPGLLWYGNTAVDSSSQRDMRHHVSVGACGGSIGSDHFIHKTSRLNFCHRVTTGAAEDERYSLSYTRQFKGLRHGKRYSIGSQYLSDLSGTS